MKDPKYLNKQAVREARYLHEAKGRGSGFNVNDYVNLHPHYAGIENAEALRNKRINDNG